MRGSSAAICFLAVLVPAVVGCGIDTGKDVTDSGLQDVSPACLMNIPAEGEPCSPEGTACDYDHQPCSCGECTYHCYCDKAFWHCWNLSELPTCNDAEVQDGGSDVVDAGIDAETHQLPQDNDCKPCADESDCGDGYFCTSLSQVKFCLKQCADDGDCRSGFTCYQASSEGLQCLPVSYKCPGCVWEGCNDDQCCDFVSGECYYCLNECDKCTYDFQCSTGYRCHKKAGNPTGHCVAECGDTGTCAQPDKFNCGDNGKGVKLCIPVSDEICSPCPVWSPFCGEPCLNSTNCPSSTPYCDNITGTCVECLNDSQCGVTLVCDQKTHQCFNPVCPWWQHQCNDGECHECCEDSHCQYEFGGTWCQSDFTCYVPEPECSSSCADPYPVCANVGGSWQCVKCNSDDDCDDDNPCTVDSCSNLSFDCLNQSIAKCVSAADCVDDNACTLNERCESNPICGLICQSDTITDLDCIDGEPCTLDYCDPNSSIVDPCVHKQKSDCPR